MSMHKPFVYSLIKDFSIDGVEGGKFVASL